MFRRFAMLALATALSAPSPHAPEQPAGSVVLHPQPPPTEHLLDADAERRHREDREEWIEQMHRAAPGVDWGSIERANGLALQEQRRRAGGSRAGTGSPWVEVGSRNLAGRMHAAVLSPAGDSLYAGSSRGGVWKADLDGAGWRPLGDNLWGGAHTIAAAPGPPETVTRATDGGDLHYTTDGGATWNAPAGPVAGLSEVRRIVVDAASPNRLYLVARKNIAWKIYRSDDGGASYSLVRGLGGHPGDVWIDRQAGGAVYALEGHSVLRSTDAGVSWTSVGTLPVAEFADVLLTGSEAGAPTLYAASDDGGWKLYRSTDAGASWEYRSDIHDFWETMTAAIADPDIVLFGGVECWRSTDGGGSFARVNSWGSYYNDMENKLHADLPGMDAVWTPDGAEILFIATDGGLYRSDDRGETVRNLSLSGLQVSQYYSTHTSANDPDLILAGAQDQGYQRSTGPAVGGARDFTQLISGDYGHITSGDGTHEWVYSNYPGFVLVQQGELFPALPYTLDFPVGEDYPWIPFILGDPNRNKAFYFCATHLYRYRKSGVSWLVDPVSSQDFTVNGGSYLTALSISPANDSRWIAFTNSGIPWHSADAGTTWAASASTGPSAHYFYGTAITHSPTDPLTAYAGGSGYSGPAVYRTTDGGATWTPVGDGLPSTLVYGLVHESPSSEVVYAASESGPYRLNLPTDEWEYLGGTTAPLTTYWSVESVPAAGVVRFATYGRGIWDYETDFATSAEPVASIPPGTPLRNHPNPFRDATVFRYRMDEAGRAALRVYDAGGRLVRVLTEGDRADGDHKVAWDGTDRDGRRVAAGVYVARLEHAGRVSVRRVTRLR